MGGRLQTFGSRALATLCFVFLFIICAAPLSADGLRFVYAKTDAWQTDLLLTAVDGPFSIDVSNCQFGSIGLKYSLNENESAKLEDYGALQCGAPIGVFSPKIDGIAFPTVVARYKDSQGYVASFEIPALFAHLPNPVEIWPIQNDDATSTFLVFFNEGSSGALATIYVYDEKNNLAGTETVTLAPGLTTHSLATKVRVGRADIRDGLPLCSICETGQSVYGFASVAQRAGGSPRVVPFSYR